MLWPSATMRRTSAGFCSAQRPVIPNVAVTPAAFRVSRICPAYPTSDPASKVRSTLRRAGDPRSMTTALPVTAVDPIRSVRPGGAGVVLGAGAVLGVGAGRALDG